MYEIVEYLLMIEQARHMPGPFIYVFGLSMHFASEQSVQHWPYTILGSSALAGYFFFKAAMYGFLVDQIAFMVKFISDN